MKSFLLILLFISQAVCIPFQSWSQDKPVNDAQENLFKIGSADASTGIVRAYDSRYEGVKGSPFYFEDWASGAVELENGLKIKDLQLKFNTYENELIVNRSGAFYLQKNDIKSFTIQEKTSGESVSFIKLPHPKKADTFQYYKLLYDGKINLIELTKVIFEKANFEGGYSNDKRFDEFKKYQEIYYYAPPNNNPVKIKTSPSGFSKVFPKHGDKIKKYIYDQSLDCTIPKDQIQIMEYYDQLQ